MRRAPLTLALTLLTACQPGGGDPEPCGGPAGNGEACTTADDCACGNTCLNARCVVLADPTDAGFDPEPEPEPEPPAMPDPNANVICQQLAALPCIDDPFTLPLCVDVWNDARARAIAAGCGAPYDAVSACQARGARCPQGDDDYWPDCADAIETLDGCQCGDDISELICQFDADTCHVGTYDLCDLGAEADCVTAGDLRECTCRTGTEPGLVFAVPLAAGECCALDRVVIDTCGQGLRPPAR